MTNEAIFAVMLSDWECLEERSTREVLEGWRDTLAAMRSEETELRKQGQWVRGAADMFGVLGISRAEVLHTKFIAWLLDPAARHGLGASFLQRLLARVFPDEQFANLDRAVPACEVARGACRADIIVWGDNFTIIIEAKVDATESKGQCDVQFAEFSHEIGSRFVFLTPRGKMPHSATGDAKEAFRTLSFAALRDDLRDALADASPAAGRAVAEDYLRTLEKEFPWPT